MTPISLAERLVPSELTAAPFPHFIRDDPLPESLAAGLLDWMADRASWRLHTATFFEQYELDLTVASVPEDLRIVFAPETLSAIAARYGALFGRHMTAQAHVTAHKLVGGQSIGIHTDEPRGERETHRLLVHINRGWRNGLGGELLLLAGDDIEALRSVVAPRHNRAIGFEMSDRSFHAVAKVQDWTRYTLIFSFWADDRPIPELGRHVTMPQREQVLAFLSDYGTGAMPHSGGHFLDHLKGVERILDRWGASLDTRLAGLMHSIYGTEGFPAISPIDRARVKSLLGPAAEGLVQRFCAMDPRSLVDSICSQRPLLRRRDGQPLDADRDQLDALLLIHLANLAEQLPRLRELQEVIEDDRLLYERVRPYALQSARIELDALFHHLRDGITDAEAEPVIAALRTFISQAGGEDVLFGRTSLIDFLSAMEEWLARHGASAGLRIAALAHGLYGWKAELTETNRAIVRVVAGDAAERLAWLFSGADDQAIAAAAATLGGGREQDTALLELAAVGRHESVTRHELDALMMLSHAAEAST